MLKMNAKAMNNVIGFPINTVANTIEKFLDFYDSTNTRVTYFGHFRKMFMYICGKDIDKIKVDDVARIDFTHTTDYQRYLKTKHKNINTVNQSIAACKILWDFLRQERIVSGDNPFAIKAMKYKDRDKNKYGSLTRDELELLYDYCESLPDRGTTKRLYFEFLATMTCRKTIAQTIKFSDLKYKKNKEDGKYYWVIDAFDKTRPINRAIPEDLYQRLKNNFHSYSAKDKDKGFLFNVENKTLEKTLKDFCQYAGIDKVGRNICQHSLKSTGLDIIQEVFEDIKLTAKSGGHANIQTLYNNYIDKNVNYSKQAAIMLGQNLSIDLLKDLSKAELIEVITSAGTNTICRLCVEGKKAGFIE